MTTSEIRDTDVVRTPSPPPRSGYRTTPREDLVTALLGSLLVGGGMTDAWAHTNILDTIESFFTPWHALLYTGYTATAAWTFWLAFRNRSRSPRWWRDGWPAGYRIGAIGAVLFAFGGLADMVWHTIFGIEVNLEATYSPSHLLLVFAAVLLLTSPLRSWWASGSERGLRAATGVVSAGLAGAIASALMLTLTAFVRPGATRPYDQDVTSEGHRVAVIAFGAFLVTTILIVVPLVLIYRRRAPLGTAPALVALVSSFAVVTYDFDGLIMSAALGAVVGAALAGVLLARLDAVRGTRAPLRLPIVGATVAGFTWTGYLLGMHLHTGIRWPADLWAGAVVLTAMLGATLGGLAAGPSNHAPPEEAGAAPDRVEAVESLN
jgi:hypothetical protein